jgi:hypothetical protein
MPSAFIAPMLTSRLTDQRLLANPGYIAEPKLDGQRAQVHVEGGRTVAAYSWPGRELLQHRGLRWLREVPWPVDRRSWTARPTGPLAIHARCRA